MKKIVNKYLMPKLMLAIFVLSGMVVFAAHNDVVINALNLAQPKVRVETSGSVKRNDKDVLLDKAEAVNSGEILNWNINSANEGNGDAQNYRVVGQIPKGTQLIPESAKADESPQVTYSIDGGKNFSAQPLIDEKQPDGTVKKVAAPVSMYSHLRFEWDKALPSNSKLAAVYRVQVK
jgi:uncharacterized repeat protein (TIGR01451 family)